MSIFSIFTGIIYNEFFSIPMTLFGSSAAKVGSEGGKADRDRGLDFCVVGWALTLRIDASEHHVAVRVSGCRGAVQGSRPKGVRYPHRPSNPFSPILMLPPWMEPLLPPKPHLLALRTYTS